MKRRPNKHAVKFLQEYLIGKGGCANCMWTRQVMQEAGFTNGQIRVAVTQLKLSVQKDADASAYARTFDAWVMR